MGNNPLRCHFEVLVRILFDVQPVCELRLREIFGPVAVQMWKFSTNVGSRRRYFFPFLIYSWQCCVQSYLHGRWLSAMLHFHATTSQTVLQLTTLGLFVGFLSFRLADGADPGPDYLGSSNECLGPGGDPSANNGASMSWLVPFLCSAINLFVTWVLRKWWKFLPPATAMEGIDYAALGSVFDRLNDENNSLRREVSSLNGALTELCSVVGRPREDLDGIITDHDRLAEQVEWQHVGMVRLGGFNPYQSLSIQQRQQVFARERRNMMAYRSMGPDRFMSTVLHQGQVVGPAKRLQCNWRGRCKVGLPQGRGNCRHPPSH